MPSLRALVRLGPRLRGSTTRCYASAATVSCAAAERNLEEWRQRAIKEARGRDPWDAFSSTNTDVSCVHVLRAQGLRRGSN
jgi:hypothetical protein